MVLFSSSPSNDYSELYLYIFYAHVSVKVRLKASGVFWTHTHTISTAINNKTHPVISHPVLSQQHRIWLNIGLLV